MVHHPGACTDMMPRHKNTNGGGFLTGQTGNSPYSIMMSAMEYNKSTSIRGMSALILLNVLSITMLLPSQCLITGFTAKAL